MSVTGLAQPAHPGLVVRRLALAHADEGATDVTLPEVRGWVRIQATTQLGSLAL